MTDDGLQIVEARKPGKRLADLGAGSNHRWGIAGTPLRELYVKFPARDILYRMKYFEYRIPVFVATIKYFGRSFLAQVIKR